MTVQQHQIALESDHHFAGRLPTHNLGFLLSDLPVAIRGAVSMSLRKQSKPPGKLPKWLREASDVRFIGHDGNAMTHLRMELPTLDVAASEIYQQPELFDTGRPEGSLTGIDLLMRVIRDIEAANADSDAFDPQLLRQISRFKRFFRASPFTGFRIYGSETSPGEVRVTHATTENSIRLYGRTPASQRVRLVGNLDGLEASTQRFSLLLDTGERIPGVYPEEISERLPGLWRKRVLVLGTSVFRASGNLLRVEADAIDDGMNASALFSHPPVASGTRLDPSRLRKPQGTRSGMAAIMGCWPGDETEEEIEAALGQLL